MIAGTVLAEMLREMGITHVVWLPDSTLGQWETALDSAAEFKLIRVAREAEAWAVASGLFLGGARPLVIMQCTGLFDSGDSLRNATIDYELPLFAIIGQRNGFNPEVRDSARDYAEPLLRAWGLSYRTIARPDQLSELSTHYKACQATRRPGAILLVEGGA